MLFVDEQKIIHTVMITFKRNESTSPLQTEFVATVKIKGDNKIVI